jgi:hypothetical protein
MGTGGADGQARSFATAKEEAGWAAAGQQAILYAVAQNESMLVGGNLLLHCASWARG